MALRFNTYKIDSYTESPSGAFRFTAIARTPGVLKYRTNSGDRYEFVSPDLNRSLDSNGFPFVGQLGGANATLEHPHEQDALTGQRIPVLLGNSQDRAERHAVGEVLPNVKVYSDGRVQVEVEVYNQDAIAAIKSGEKVGVSCGYQAKVIRKDGIWNGQRYTHVQSSPLVFDHLAIVSQPRAGGALITRHDSADDADVAWYVDAACCGECEGKPKKKKKTLSMDGVSMKVDGAIAGLLQRLDKGKGCPGPGDCKGGKGLVRKESNALKGLGKTKTPKATKNRIAELKAKLTAKNSSSKTPLKSSEILSAAGISEGSDRDKGKGAITAANTKRAKTKTANAKRAATKKVNKESSGLDRIASEQRVRTHPRTADELGASLSSQVIGEAKGRSQQAKKQAKKQRTKKRDSAIASILDSLNMDGTMANSLIPVKLDGQTYHLDSDGYDSLLATLAGRMDADDDEDEEDEDEVMDSSDDDDEEDEDEDEAMEEKYKDLPSSFLKNIKKNKAKAKSKADSMQSRIDHLEGQLAVAAQLLVRADKNDEDEDEKESMDSAIAERLDELFTAFDDAQSYLPSDFKLDGAMTGADVKLAAILNFNPDLKLDSVESVEGAYEMLKLGRRSDGVNNLRSLVSPPANGKVRRDAMSDVKDMYENAWKEEQN